jgi:monoamine oxidase
MNESSSIYEETSRRGLSRRRLLAATGATAAGYALPSAAIAGTGRRRRSADVVVIGAGLAGLTAARTLVARGKSVVVLEARSRVGGRTHTIPLGRRDWIDVGGQWVGPTQDGILALADEVGVKTFETYNSGDNILWWEGESTRYPATAPVPPVPDGGDQALITAVVELDSLAAELPPGEPWAWNRATEFDGQTFETWKLATFSTRGARVAMDVAIEAVFACQPRDVSALFVLYYISQAGNAAGKGSLARLISTAGGAQESRFVGGAEKVSRKVARRLGKRLVLGAPVRRIRRTGSGVRVVADGVTVSARRAIVALSPTLAGRIQYDPALPALRDQLTQRVPQGSAIKVNVVYSEPFWRNDGLSGQVVSDEGPIKVTFDNSPPDGSPGMLVGFLEGHDARLWGRRSPKLRRQAVLESLARYFGPAGGSPTRYVETNWAEAPWTRGCYEGFTPPGVLVDFGEALRKPVGPIHWAGTETATRWIGYMDGAVESGERAAKEVLASL